MKPRYFLFRVMLVSVFGLISCAPDESPDQKQMFVEQSNGNVTAIKGKRIINPDDSFFIDNLEENLTAAIKTICYYEESLHNFEKNTVISGKKISFLPLLPPEVFLPKVPGQKDVKCKFTGNISSPSLGTQDIGFSEPMNVANTNTFFNIRWENIQPGWSNILSRDDLSALEIPIALQNKKLVSLCDSMKSVSAFSGNLEKTVDLFPDQIFNKQASANCRLWVHNENNDILITPIFNLKKETIYLKFSQSSQFQVVDQIDHRTNPMLTLEFTNMNSFPLYLKYLIPITDIQLTPHFMYHTDPGLYYETIYNIQGHWVYTGPNIDKFGEITLLPDESFSFSLVTNQKLNCGDWITKARLSGGSFNPMDPTIMGYKIKITGLPMINQPSEIASRNERFESQFFYLNQESQTIHQWTPTKKPEELKLGRTEVIDGLNLPSKNWSEIREKNPILNLHTPQCQVL